MEFNLVFMHKGILTYRLFESEEACHFMASVMGIKEYTIENA